LVDWIKETLISQKTIAPEDVDLFHLTDDGHEAVEIISHFYEEHSLGPNF